MGVRSNHTPYAGSQNGRWRPKPHASPFAGGARHLSDPFGAACHRDDCNATRNPQTAVVPECRKQPN
jgi:hypothetical protein